MAIHTLLLGGYSGLITTLLFDTSANPPNLRIQSTNDNTKPSPGWLFNDKQSQIIYAGNEGPLSGEGPSNIDGYVRNGEKIDKKDGEGAVAGVVSLDIRDGLMVSASYAGAGVNTFSV